MLYACDGAWWKYRKGVPDFGGLKITADSTAATKFRDIHKINVLRKVDRIQYDNPGDICDGGNSGLQLFNLVAQFGVARIILVGFDMRLDRGVHWHGSHPDGLNNPRPMPMLQRWRKSFDNAAHVLARLGIEVLNASPVSTISAYPFVDLDRLASIGAAAE